MAVNRTRMCLATSLPFSRIHVQNHLCMKRCKFASRDESDRKLRAGRNISEQ